MARLGADGRLLKGLLSDERWGAKPIVLPRAGNWGVTGGAVTGYCRVCGEPSTVERVKSETGYFLDATCGCAHVTDAYDRFSAETVSIDVDEEQIVDDILEEFVRQIDRAQTDDDSSSQTPAIAVHERTQVAKPQRTDSLWTPLDLRNAEQVPFLVEPLLYQGCHHVCSGEKGKGKSLFWLRVAYELGARAAWLDQEVYLRGTLPRLKGFGAEPGDEATLPLYSESGAFSYKRFEAEVFPALKEAEVEVVFLDPMRLFYRAAGVNDSGAYGGVDEYALKVIQPLNLAGIATVALDNTTLAGGKRSKGDGAKGDNVELEWHLTQPSQVTLDRTGVIQLECVKDRHGRVGERTVYKYRFGGTPTVFEPVGAGRAVAKPLATNADLDARILADSEAALAEGPLSTNKLKQAVVGDTTRKAAVLERAAAEGRLVKEKAGGGAVMWRLPDEHEVAA